MKRRGNLLTLRGEGLLSCGHNGIPEPILSPLRNQMITKFAGFILDIDPMCGIKSYMGQVVNGDVHTSRSVSEGCLERTSALQSRFSRAGFSLSLVRPIAGTFMNWPL